MKYWLKTLVSVASVVFIGVGIALVLLCVAESAGWLR